MMDRLEARAATLAARRVAKVRAAILSAELPPGCSAVEDGDGDGGAIVIRGPGLVRRLAFDPRMRALAGGR